MISFYIIFDLFQTTLALSHTELTISTIRDAIHSNFTRMEPDSKLFLNS